MEIEELLEFLTEEQKKDLGKKIYNKIAEAINNIDTKQITKQIEEEIEDIDFMYDLDLLETKNILSRHINNSIKNLLKEE